jgi:UDP-glucose 4-epimerase
MQKHILVTGGAGYIGSHTVVSLVENGYTPIILDDFRNANRIVLDGMTQILGKKPHLFELDICDDNGLRAFFQKYNFEGVIHFAAHKAVGESVLDPLKYYQNKVDGIFPEITGPLNEFSGSNNITGASSGATAQPDVNFPAVPGSSTRTINNTDYDLGMNFTGGYANPELQKNSGEIIYIDNRRPISRANDQIEDIKIVIEF